MEANIPVTKSNAIAKPSVLQAMPKRVLFSASIRNQCVVRSHDSSQVRRSRCRSPYVGGGLNCSGRSYPN
ncbi:hypothetical protein TNCV_2481591 [Trichonephila clavipes]|nr:hypothetical protein TNCV_2481591 [Trichonephila clavipes]